MYRRSGVARALRPDWRADELRSLIREELPRLRAMKDRDGALVRLAEIESMIAAVNGHLAESDRIPPVEL